LILSVEFQLQTQRSFCRSRFLSANVMSFSASGVLALFVATTVSGENATRLHDCQRSSVVAQTPGAFLEQSPFSQFLGQTVALYCEKQGRYVSLSDKGMGVVSSPKPFGLPLPKHWTWELFKVVDAGNGRVAFHSAVHNKFLRMNNKQDMDASPVKNYDQLPPEWGWEKFTPVDAGNGNWAFHQKDHNRFIRMNNKQDMDASSVKNLDQLPGGWTWERFKVLLVSTPAAVAPAAGPAPWHLAPGGSHACDAGTPAPEGECQKLVKGFATENGKTPGRPLQVGQGGTCNDGGWGQVPAGCSAQSGGDWAPHFKKGPGMGAGCIASAYQLVCSGPEPGLPAPSGPEPGLPAPAVVPVAAAPAIDPCAAKIDTTVKINNVVQEAVELEKAAEEAVSESKEMQETVAEVKAAKANEQATAATQLALNKKAEVTEDEVKAEVKEVKEKKEIIKAEKVVAANVAPEVKEVVVAPVEEQEEEVEEEEVEVKNKEEKHEAEEEEATAATMEAVEAQATTAATLEKFKAEDESLEKSKEIIDADKTFKVEMKVHELQVAVAAAPPVAAAPAAAPAAAKVDVAEQIKQAEVSQVQTVVKVITTAKEEAKEAAVEQEKAEEMLKEVKATDESQEDKIQNNFDTLKKLMKSIKKKKCRPCGRKLRKAQLRIRALRKKTTRLKR